MFKIKPVKYKNMTPLSEERLALTRPETTGRSQSFVLKPKLNAQHGSQKRVLKQKVE